jgi:hypothetical protein
VYLGERQPICPHCQRPFGGLRYGIKFGALALRIIDTIERAGPDGIDTSTLFEIVYRDRPSKRSALKSYIHHINETLRDTGTHIVCEQYNGGVYRLDTRRPVEMA